MLSNPRIGLFVSLAIAAVAALWLLAQGLAGDAVWEALWPVVGYGVHAITLLSIFVLVAAPPVALLFRHYARVRADLLAGRNVIARWKVDPSDFKTFSKVAEASDRRAKRGALYLVLVFTAVIFGGFALFDPEVAPLMLAAGAAFCLLMIVSLWLSNRVSERHLQWRSGEIIVGTQGLLINGVLHVWHGFLSWLSDVTLEKGPPAALTITYTYLARYGPQDVSVMLPVPADGMTRAREVEKRLSMILGKARSRTRHPRAVAR